MIAIIDYGAGNLHSVYNALQTIGCACVITSSTEDLKRADGLILPGVGAFYDSMKSLEKSGLIACIKEEVAKNKPLLGICLGMQMLFEKGYEVHPCDGLGLLQGDIVPMQDDFIKIPHMGWNTLETNVPDTIMSDFNRPPFAYFVHSFYAQNYKEEDVVSYTTYGPFKIPAYVAHGCVMGMQYHPEKSGEDGLAMLRKFKEMCV